MRMTRRWARALLAALAIALAGAIPAQTIRIPDFRTDPRFTGPCENCGTVRSIREQSRARPLPACAGALLTPAGSDPFSGQNLVGGIYVADFADGKPYAGGVGTPEMRERFGDTTYEITVRLDDGGFRTIERRDGGRFRVGDRVRFEGTELQLI